MSYDKVKPDNMEPEVLPVQVEKKNHDNVEQILCLRIAWKGRRIAKIELRHLIQNHFAYFAVQGIVEEIPDPKIYTPCDLRDEEGVKVNELWI